MATCQRLVEHLRYIEDWRERDDNPIKTDLRLISTLFMLIGFFDENAQHCIIPLKVRKLKFFDEHVYMFCTNVGFFAIVWGFENLVGFCIFRVNSAHTLFFFSGFLDTLHTIVL